MKYIDIKKGELFNCESCDRPQRAMATISQKVPDQAKLLCPGCLIFFRTLTNQM